MSENAQKNEAPSATLCKACGLCCTGHLFVTTDLKPAEVETAKTLGLNVLQGHPEMPIFQQPCPLWKGQCTIYTHPHKPSICGDFTCKLLREVEGEQLQLDEALIVVQRTKQLIHTVEEQLPAGSAINFRKRLTEYVNQLMVALSPDEAENSFRLKAGVLFVLFAQRFGVADFFNKQEQETAQQE